MRGRRGGFAARVAGSACLVAAVVLLGASSALAAYEAKETFGSVSQPTFTKPVALAVDQGSHDLYVVDVEAKTISRWKPNGEPDPFSALSGSNVIDGAGGPDETPQTGLEFGFGNPREVQIAIDESGGATDGDIYVTQPRHSHNLIDIFASSGAYLGQLTASSEGAFGVTAGVAVDPAGAVYVSDLTNGKIHKYVPAADPPTNADNTANFTRASAATLAAGANSTAGAVFADKFGSEPLKLDSSSGASQCVVSTGESLALAVNPADGHLFSAGESEVKEYAGSCATEPETPLDEFAPGGGIRGVAVDGGGLVYVSREGVSTIAVWKEQGALPIVAPNGAEAVGVESATLTGTVNPNGLAVSECFFEYDTTPYTEAQEPGSEAEPAHGRAAPCGEYESGGEWHLLFDPAELGEGSSPVPVKSKVALESGTTYHFRLDASNVNGTAAGTDETLKTLGAQIAEVSASPISSTAARVNAWVDPDGEATTFHVQYTTRAAFEAGGWSSASATAAAAVPAQSTGTGDLSAASGSGDLASGSNLITNVSTAEGAFAVGQEVEGTGIPAGARINAVDTINNRLTISKAATAAGSSVPLAAGSKTITGLTVTSGRFLPEQNGLKQAIEGAGIAPGTTIVSVAGTEMVLSKPATAAGKGVELVATGPQAVHAQLTGLLPGTPYRYRVVAANAVEAHSPTEAFTTYEAAGPPLPDGRAWELVTPALKAGEVIPPNANTGLGGTCQECLPGETTPAMPMQSAPGGDGVLYEGQPFAEGLYSGPNEYVSGREASGWGWQGLNGPATTGAWQAFSSDLARGVLSQEEPPLSPLAPTRGGHGFAELYLREADGSLVPLITAEPPNRSPGKADFANKLRIRYSGANAGTASAQAFSHVAFEANDSLSEAVAGIAPQAPDPGAGQECTGGGECELYEWSGGQLHLVNVLPGNAEAAGEAAIGSGRLLNQTGAEFEVPNTSNAVSADGRTIFWSSAETGHVYARIDASRTLLVPGPATCEEAPSPAACFLTASADGSKVLLGDGQIDRLNPLGSGYEKVGDLTAEKGGFEGILGAAEDLSRVYFVDSKVLTGAEVNANGEAAEEGANNLYAWQGGASRFVGRLTSKDGSFGVSGRYGAWRASASNRTAQVSSDGRFAAFMSQAPLTGYENDHAGGGGCIRGNSDPACFEAFEYAADTNTLSCASCNPSGQAPIGGSNLSLLAPKGTAPPFAQPGDLSRSGEGRLFFESQDALSPQDTNGSIQDVYEWEPAGVGGCAKPGGCVALISGGSAAGDSMFLDSSSSGDDAFFITRQRLVPADVNEQLDLYDARVGGGFAEEAAQPCGGEACKGPVAEAPAQAAAGTASFAGPGNPKTEKQAKKKKKHRKHHKKKHKGKKHKKKSHSKKRKRGAKRGRGGAR